MSIFAAAVAVAAVFFAVGAAPTAAAGATFVVMKTDVDSGDTDLGDAVCSTVPIPPNQPKPPPDPTTCTLRAAIQNANKDPDKNTIAFQLPAGAATIKPGGWLPSLDHPVEIDGFTQSGGSSGGSVIPQPRVHIDGSEIAPVTRCLDLGNLTGGLVVRGAQSVIRGLHVFGFPCDDIVVSDAARSTISANFIGTNAAGTVIDSSPVAVDKNGIEVENSPGTTIGGAAPGDGNVVTTSTEFAMRVLGGSSNVVIQHNKVGVSPAGDRPTAAGVVGPITGIALIGRLNGAPAPIDRAVVSDNQIAGLNGLPADGLLGQGADAGIVVTNGVTNAEIARNLIGVGDDGKQMVVLGQPYSEPNAEGIWFIAPASEPSDSPQIRDNVIGAMRNGIVLRGAGVQHARAEGNVVGVAKDRTTAIPNDGVGILMADETHDNTIGYAKSEIPDKGCAAGSKCNIVANNGQSGVALETPPKLQEPPGSGTPAGSRNPIRGNSIYRNMGAGIDRPGYGITPNVIDVTDENVDFPIGVTVSEKGVSGLVQVADPQHADLRIDVYRLDPGPDQTSGPNDRGVMRPGVAPDGSLAWPSSPTVDNPSSFGEGRTWVGTVAQDMIGHAGNWLLPLTTTPDERKRYAYTATVTDSKGNTSEFSAFCPNDYPLVGPDTDGDSLCNDWERLGIDNNGDGQNDLRLQDPPFNADPNEPDIFVEVDYLDNSRPHDIPEPGWPTGADANGLSAVVQAFADAPNPIRLHLSPGSGVGLVDEPVFGGGLTTWFDSGQASADSNFFEIKNGGQSPCDGSFGTYADRTDPNCAAILGAKSLVFRYVLFANEIAGAPDTGGRAEIGGSDAIIALSHLPDDQAVFAGGGHFVCWQLHSCWADWQGSTFMHELGHTLGLRHGGAGNLDNKPNQFSIMNDAYSDRTYTPFRSLDYSRYALETLDEANLDESKGLDLASLSSDDVRDLKSRFPEVAFTSPATSTACKLKDPPIEGPIDWNNDGRIEARVSQYLRPKDADDCLKPDRSELESFEEWSRLDFNFRDRDQRTEANRVVRESPSSPTERAAQIDHDGDGVNDLHDNCQAIANPRQVDSDQDGLGDRCDTTGAPTNVSVRILPDRVTAAPGQSNRFVVEVTNDGPNRARGVLGSVFSSGLTSASYTEDHGTYANTQWAIGDLAAMETAQLTISAHVTGAYSISVNVAGANAQLSDPGRLADTLSVFQLAGGSAPGVGSGTGHLVCLPNNDPLPGELNRCYWIGPDAINPTSQPAIRVDTVDHQYFPDSDRLFTLAVAVDPNGPALNGTNALVNAHIFFPIPSGFQFVAAQLDDTSSDFGQPWSYNPSTGIWRMPPAARFINTLLVTVRPTSAPESALVAGHIVSWEGTTPSPVAFEDHEVLGLADPATVVPDNDERANARPLTGTQGTTNGDLGHATSRYTPPGASGTPAVLDLPNMPPRNYRTVWFTYHATGVGRFDIDLRTSPGRNVQQYKSEALTVFNTNGAIVFGTKPGDKFPTARGSFMTAPGSYAIVAYYNTRSLADFGGDLFSGSIPYTLSWKFTDTTPPQTTITRGPRPRTNEKAPLFSFSSNEPGSTFACRLDGGAAVTCTSPFRTVPLADGAHTFSVAATDRTGNVDPTPASRSFKIDSTPPETVITLGPRGQITNRTPRFVFQSSEPNSTFRCRVDDRPWADCRSPRQYGPLPLGSHVVIVQATDVAGNRDPTPARQPFTIVPIPHP